MPLVKVKNSHIAPQEGVLSLLAECWHTTNHSVVHPKAPTPKADSLRGSTVDKRAGCGVTSSTPDRSTELAL